MPAISSTIISARWRVLAGCRRIVHDHFEQAQGVFRGRRRPRPPDPWPRARHGATRWRRLKAARRGKRRRHSCHDRQAEVRRAVRAMSRMEPGARRESACDRVECRDGGFEVFSLRPQGRSRAEDRASTGLGAVALGPPTGPGPRALTFGAALIGEIERGGETGSPD